MLYIQKIHHIQKMDLAITNKFKASLNPLYYLQQIYYLYSKNTTKAERDQWYVGSMLRGNSSRQRGWSHCGSYVRCLEIKIVLVKKPYLVSSTAEKHNCTG